MDEVIIYVDGAARGNPGPAAIAAVIKDRRGETITTISRRIGTSTNNNAEYQAVILGLERAITVGAKLVEIRSDSELVVQQINGRYLVRNTTLTSLHQQVRGFANSLEGFAINHIPRKQNNDANTLVNKTLNLVRHINYVPRCELFIRLKETDNENGDILFLHRLIDILNRFPGSDQVTLRLSTKNSSVTLKLSNVQVNYCYELRELLRELVGKRGIKVKRLE